MVTSLPVESQIKKSRLELEFQFQINFTFRLTSDVTNLLPVLASVLSYYLSRGSTPD